jgi:transcriptional regulator, XRE family
MKSRIKELRNYLGMSGEVFGEKLGLTKQTISRLENGVNGITEQTIKLICQEFNVNEKWLRTGEGEMFEPIDEKELREKLLNDHANPNHDPARAAFIKAVVDLSDTELDIVLKFMENTIKEYKKNTGD